MQQALQYSARVAQAASSRRSAGRTMATIHHNATSASTAALTGDPVASPIRLAILHQSLSPPLLNGVCKPAKPGGYKDSGSDIAHALLRSTNVDILTPVERPDPTNQDHWTFPEDEGGLLEAVRRGATHLWANVHTYAAHPLQTSAPLSAVQERLMIVGQPPCLADWADDKAWFGEYLRSRAAELNLALPKAIIVDRRRDVDAQLRTAIEKLSLPVIVKPPRGRGSSGVNKCDTERELKKHAEVLLNDGESVIVEEYLSGEEGTVAVMPPVPDVAAGRYRALPFVQRFDQCDGVMAYSGKTPVSVNSRALTLKEIEGDKMYGDIMRQCEVVASLLQATAPIRIDVRRASDGRFRVFDVNLKPNYTGPGRPGRDDQLNLMGMGAEQVGWSYSRFVRECLARARPLSQLRRIGGQFNGNTHEARLDASGVNHMMQDISAGRMAAYA